MTRVVIRQFLEGKEFACGKGKAMRFRRFRFQDGTYYAVFVMDHKADPKHLLHMQNIAQRITFQPRVEAKYDGDQTFIFLAFPSRISEDERYTQSLAFAETYERWARVQPSPIEKPRSEREPAPVISIDQALAHPFRSDKG